MTEKKARDFIPKVEKILGEGYTVEEASMSGNLKASKGSVLMFRIFYSMYAGKFVVRLDGKEHKKIGEKVASELGMDLIDPFN